MEPTNKGGRPKLLKGHKLYKSYLPTEAAEWAKENGGLSELLRDCLEQKYQRSASSAGDVLKETPD